LVRRLGYSLVKSGYFTVLPNNRKDFEAEISWREEVSERPK
jgi:hypothetical protein